MKADNDVYSDQFVSLMDEAFTEGYVALNLKKLFPLKNLRGNNSSALLKHGTTRKPAAGVTRQGSFPLGRSVARRLRFHA